MIASSAARRVAAMLALATCALCGVRAAHAEPSALDRALAEELFLEGKRLMAEGRVAEGCSKLAESQALDPGGGTLLNLAVCHEAEGKTATAWVELRAALAQASRDGRDDRIALAEERLRALEPRLARLRVTVPAESRLAGLQVTVDDAPLREGSWGTTAPVDPGAHTVTADAPGRRSWSTTVVAADEGQQIEVSVPLLTPLPPALGARAMVLSWPPVAAPSREQRTSPMRTAGWVTGGVGAAALTVGAAFGVAAMVAASDAESACRGGLCFSDEGQRDSDRAHAFATTANITVGAGLVAAAVGVALVLASGATPERSARKARVTSWR
jgi:hypothetical protein